MGTEKWNNTTKEEKNAWLKTKNKKGVEEASLSKQNSKNILFFILYYIYIKTVKYWANPYKLVIYDSRI